jgi:DNA-binding CsgD family transcriptional regulator
VSRPAPVVPNAHEPPVGFVGRQRELEALSSIAGTVMSGASRVVWVEGEAGSGKTSLVRQALSQLPPNVRIRRATGEELAVEVEFAVMDQLTTVDSRSPFAAGLELLTRIHENDHEEPVVVVVEDLHWADTASRQALLTFARRLEQDRVLLIVTSRPRATSDGWERLQLDPARCTVLSVEPFSIADVAALAELLDLPLGPESTERLHHHTDGHPLYVRMLLAEVDPEALASGADLPVPRSLASTIVATLAGLPEPARRLASALAVFNCPTPLAMLGQVAGITDSTTALELLLATGFVQWSPREDGSPVDFSHPLHRLAIYDDLTPSLRRHYHLEAAALADASTALDHRFAAADGPDQALAEALAEAARECSRQRALSSASSYYVRASECSADPQDRSRYLLQAVELLLEDQKISRAASFLGRVDACVSGARRSLVLGLLAWSVGDTTRAEHHLSDARSMGAAESQVDVLTSALVHLSTLYFSASDGERALATANEAVALDSTDPDLCREAWSALAVAQGLCAGAPAGIERLVGRLPERPREVADEEVGLLTTRGTLRFYASHTDAAIADLRGVTEKSRGSVAVRALPRAHIHLAQLLLARGDWDEAELHARVGLSLVEDEGHLWIEAQAHAALGTILASRGEWEPAQNHSESARQAAVGLGTAEMVFTACYLDASIARARSEPQGVVDALGPLAEFPERIPMLSSLSWWSVLVEALIDLDDVAAARRHLNELASGVAARRLNFDARLAGHRARLSAAAGNDEEARLEFVLAIDLLTEDDPLLDQASMHRAFGRFLAPQDRRAATVQLEDAHRLLASVGAGPFLEVIDRDLASIGTPARGRTNEGRSSIRLTDRQRDVATLVAKGLTNRETADRLYLSEKAIEYHLGLVFGKLGIRSRRELREHPAIATPTT